MASVDDVMAALSEIQDPEIGINLVDLGLVYDAKVHDKTASVALTLTTPGCPLHTTIRQQVEERLMQVPGIEHADVELVWAPPWTPDRISDEGRSQLRQLHAMG